MNDDTKSGLSKVGLGAVFSSAALAGDQLMEYGAQTGSYALAGAGAVLASVGRMCTAVSVGFLSVGVLTPTVGVVTGLALTTGAFKYAGNPIFERYPLIKPEVKEKTLTLEERQAMKKSFQTDPALQYQLQPRYQ